MKTLYVINLEKGVWQAYSTGPNSETLMPSLSLEDVKRTCSEHFGKDLLAWTEAIPGLKWVAVRAVPIAEAVVA